MHDLDCNDNDPTLNPGTIWYYDQDGDGFSDGTTQTGCTDPGADWYTPAELQSEPGIPAVCVG